MVPLVCNLCAAAHAALTALHRRLWYGSLYRVIVAFLLLLLNDLQMLCRPNIWPTKRYAGPARGLQVCCKLQLTSHICLGLLGVAQDSYRPVCHEIRGASCKADLMCHHTQSHVDASGKAADLVSVLYKCWHWNMIILHARATCVSGLGLIRCNMLVILVSLMSERAN